MLGESEMGVKGNSEDFRIFVKRNLGIVDVDVRVEFGLVVRCQR